MEVKVKLKSDEVEGMIVVCQIYIDHLNKQKEDDTIKLVKSILTSCSNKFEHAKEKSKKRKFFNLV
jgi:hypothetical protein